MTVVPHSPALAVEPRSAAPFAMMYEILGMHKSDIFTKAGQFWHGTPYETRILAISNENLPPAPPDHVRTRQIS
jgi:hypothetical protein